jgi:hypothetical protein
MYTMYIGQNYTLLLYIALYKTEDYDATGVGVDEMMGAGFKE